MEWTIFILLCEYQQSWCIIYHWAPKLKTYKLRYYIVFRLWVAVVIKIQFMKNLCYVPEFVGFQTGGIFDHSLVLNFLIPKKIVCLLPGFPKSRPKRPIFIRYNNLTGSAYPVYLLLELTLRCECCCCCNGSVMTVIDIVIQIILRLIL